MSVHSLHTPGRQEAVWYQLHRGSQASRLVWSAKILLWEEQKRQGRALEWQGSWSRWIARPASAALRKNMRVWSVAEVLDGGSWSLMRRGTWIS